MERPSEKEQTEPIEREEQAVSPEAGAKKPGAENPVPGPKRGVWRGVLAGLGYFGFYLLVQTVVSTAAAVVFAVQMILDAGLTDVSALVSGITARAQEAAMPLTLLVNVLTLAGFYLFFRIRKKNVADELCCRRVAFSKLLPLIPLGISLNVLVSSLLALLPADWLAGYEAASAAVLGDGLDLFTALMVAVLAPITEEVLFRGLVYTRFSRALPRPLALLLAALLFGLMHLQPVWIAYATVFGALLCAVMDRYRSLAAAITLHMAFNAGSFFVLLLGGVSVTALIPVSAALVAGLLMTVFRKTERAA